MGMLSEEISAPSWKTKKKYMSEKLEKYIGRMVIITFANGKKLKGVLCYNHSLFVPKNKTYCLNPYQEPDKNGEFPKYFTDQAGGRFGTYSFYFKKTSVKDIVYLGDLYD